MEPLPTQTYYLMDAQRTDFFGFCMGRRIIKPTAADIRDWIDTDGFCAVAPGPEKAIHLYALELAREGGSLGQDGRTIQVYDNYECTGEWRVEEGEEGPHGDVPLVITKLD